MLAQPIRNLSIVDTRNYLTKTDGYDRGTRREKQMDTAEIRSTENNTKPKDKRVKRAVLFRFQRVKTEFFSLRLQNSYS